jgi:transposase
MELFVGLDVSQETTHLSVVDNTGREIWQGKCPTTPAHLTAKLQEKAPAALKIGLETGPLATWLWHDLTALGLPVVCLDARHARVALSMQVNKSDRNDALGLAQIVRTGWYREVKVKSFDNHRIRAVLGARAQIVGMRTDVSNQIRGLLKNFGEVPGKGKLKDLDPYLQGDDLLAQTLRALSKVLDSLNVQIQRLDDQIDKLTRTDVQCQLLMTIPGVGPLTAPAATTAAVPSRQSPTSALSTPGTPWSACLTCLAQPSQVIPSTRKIK